MPVLIEEIANDAEADRRIYGVAIAQVIDNLDSERLGRVQLHFPWLPQTEPWARVAVLATGNNSGTFFIPQVGDEVLVAFNHGEVLEPFVIGSLWNGRDQPPAQGGEDAVNLRLIRTPGGHEITFDDLERSITIKTDSDQKITLDTEKIEVEAADSKLTLNTSGAISIESSVSIELKAPRITIEATATLDIKGDTSVSINGGTNCSVQADLVQIN